MVTRSLLYAWIWMSIFSVACHNDQPQSRPNILLIVSEDNSPDLGCYGNDIVHTPHLDQLAQDGFRFVNAYTTNAVCSPSRSSIFTGLYPHQNGQFGWATHHYAMYEGIRVLPDYLKEAGYATACIGKIHVNPEDIFNFDFTGIQESNFAKEKMDQYAAKAVEFTSSIGDKPYFMMVNYPDAHLPFQNDVEGLPTVKVDRNRINSTLSFVGVNSERLFDETERYYNCMNRLDESIGMLLDSLGDLSNTVVIYLSDHGAQFSRGKLTNYEGGLKVPFIVHWPDRYPVQNEVRDELISVVDILPTVMEIAGIEKPDFLPGKSLIGLLDNPNQEWRSYLAAEGEGSSPVFYFPRRSIRNHSFKLIHNIDVGRSEFPAYHAYTKPDFKSGSNQEEIEASSDEVRRAYALWKNPPEYELYDLRNDPGEFNNLSHLPEYADTLQMMINELFRWREETNDPLLDQKKLELLTAEMDSINQVYPDHTYRSVEGFKWGYLDYLKPEF